MTTERLQTKDFMIVKEGMIYSGTPNQVLETVNTWMSNNPVRVINVETIYNDGRGVGPGVGFIGARVWFMAAGVVE